MTQTEQRVRTPKPAPAQPIIQITPDLLAEALKLAGIEERVSDRIDGAVRTIQQFAVALDERATAETEPPRPPLPADLSALEQTISANDAAAARHQAAAADARRQLVDEVAILRRENARLYAALNGTNQTIRNTEAAWHAGQPDMAKLFGTVRVNDELCEQHDADLRAFYDRRDNPSVRDVAADLGNFLVGQPDDEPIPESIRRDVEHADEPHGDWLPSEIASHARTIAAVLVVGVGLTLFGWLA